MAKAKKFSANDAAQPVYDAIHAVIKTLPNDQAIAVLEEIDCHVNGMIEGIKDDQNEEGAES